ncbi:MAG: sigma-70 family RNA polymerase sigma factor [Archangium sp.]
MNSSESFRSLVAEVRPELHRYCARMTGNVFDGEDIVQDTLSKAFVALEEAKPSSLRSWLFRIAHNAALDFLKRKSVVELHGELPELEVMNDEPPDVALPLAAFGELPVLQRSAVILKDVLGLSLEETSAAMNSSVPAVKGALTRGRLKLAKVEVNASTPNDPRMQRYADLFNARDWDALRELLSDEAKLELVGRSRREGREVRQYFARYAEVAQEESLRAVPGFVDAVPVLAMLRGEALAYFVCFGWRGESISSIRDYYFVPYIAHEARFTPA